MTPLIALIVYIVSFSAGFGPIPWLLMGELLPTRSKGLGAALTTGANWTGTFVITKTFLDLRNLLGPGLVFWMYGVIMGMALVFTAIFLPETKGKSLEEIESIFSDKTKDVNDDENDQFPLHIDFGTAYQDEERYDFVKLSQVKKIYR